MPTLRVSLSHPQLLCFCLWLITLCIMSSQDALGGAASLYPSLFLLCSSLSLAYAFVTAVYRLYFHPLASFPGPFWARLTVIPSWWHTRTGDRHIWLHNLQEQYGMGAALPVEACKLMPSRS